MQPSHEVRSAVREYASRHPEEFAGAWIETVNGRKRLFAAFTARTHEHRRDLPDEVIVVSRPWTIDQLTAEGARAVSAAERGGILVQTWSVNHRTGHAVLTIVGDHADRVALEPQDGLAGALQFETVPETAREHCAIESWKTTDQDDQIQIAWSAPIGSRDDVTVHETSTTVEINAGAIVPGEFALGPSETRTTTLQLRTPLGTRRVALN